MGQMLPHYTLLAILLVVAGYAAEDQPALPSVPPVRVLSWEACMATVRSSKPTPFAVYFGSRDNRLARGIATGAIPVGAIPFALVASGDKVLNPIANAPMRGLDLQRLFGATAGTIIFFDERGLPLYDASIPQVVHGGDPDLVALYCAYVAGRHYTTMSIPEYARAMGKEQVVIRAVDRTGGRATGREVPKGGRLVTGINVISGQANDPWQESGVFYVYTSDPHGRVFLAQIQEIWGAFRALSPHITLIIPKGASRPTPEELPDEFQGVLTEAALPDILRQGVTPHVVLVAGNGTEQRALVLGGFQPAEALASIMHLPIDKSAINRDIPFSETDNVVTQRDALVDVPAASGPAAPATAPATPLIDGH